MRTRYGLPASLRTLDARACALPSLPALSLVLARATGACSVSINQLESIVLDAARSHVLPLGKAA